MTIHRILAVSFVGFYLYRSPNCGAATVPEVRALAVLFRQFETVSYTHSDFVSSIDTRESGHGETNLRLPLPMRLPFVGMVGGLRFFGATGVSALERSYPAFAAGAKDFGAPVGADGGGSLGAVSSQDCYIGVLQHGPQPDLASVFSPAQTTSIAGIRVWTWSIPPYEGHPSITTFYAAQIADLYFLMANDQHVFIDAERELVSSKSTSISMLGWNAIGKQTYWIYRPTSRTKTSAPNPVYPDMPPTVLALAFFADGDGKNGYVQAYVSGEATKTTLDSFPAAKLIHYERVSGGVWQGSLPLEENAPNTAVYGILFYFGFGVAL